LTTGSVDQNDLGKLLNTVDIFWFRLAYKINSTVLNENTRCKYFLSPVTGIDHIDEKLCASLNKEIICLRGETEFLKEVRATSEHTVLLTQMLMRRAYHAVVDTQKGLWRRDLFRGFELYKKQVGVIGLGRLGSIVADYFLAFGCEVTYYDVASRVPSDPAIKKVSLEELCEKSEIITLHIPLNESTVGIYDREFFISLKQKPYLINTSRGAIIDEAALLDALMTKKISGAAIDVLIGEPEVKNNPLIKYAQSNSNLIITPHIGGNTYESFEKTEMFIAQKLLQSVSGN